MTSYFLILIVILLIVGYFAYVEEISWLYFFLCLIGGCLLYFYLLSCPLFTSEKAEQAYFIGQRDALNGDIRIKLNNDSCYVWTKSPWENGTKLEFIPIKPSSKTTISYFFPSLSKNIEQAYFIGQRDALNGNVNIELNSDSCYVWTKSPWPDGRRTVFIPTYLDTKTSKLKK